LAFKEISINKSICKKPQKDNIAKEYTPSWYSPCIFLPERLMGRDGLMVITLIFHDDRKSN